MSLVGIAPMILCVTNDLPVKNVAELIDYAKKNPGKISFGSSGVGAAAHLTSELLKQVAGIEMVHVPYKGTAPALADLAAGNLQMLIDAPIGVMSNVRAGKVRALCMLSKERVPGVEEVPTIVEAGGPPIEGSSWVMFLAPAGTPKEIVDRLAGRGRQGDDRRRAAQAVRRVCRDPGRLLAGRHGQVPERRDREVGQGDLDGRREDRLLIAKGRVTGVARPLRHDQFAAKQ